MMRRIFPGPLNCLESTVTSITPDLELHVLLLCHDWLLTKIALPMKIG